MKRMGLEKMFQAKRTPEEGMQMVNNTGRQRAWFPAVKPKGGEKQGFTTEYEVMRGDICRILHDAAASNSTRAGAKTSAKYIFNTAVGSFVQSPSAVDVRFEDGTSDSYDLLVGADGQWSRTRHMMLAAGPEPIKAGGSGGLHHIPGLYFAYFTMQRPIQDGEGYIATSYLAPKKRGIMTRRHSPTELQVILSCRTNSELMRNIPRGDVDAEKEAMARIFQGAGWQSDEIVAAMRKAPDFYCERPGLVKIAPWSRGRVALVGDAAYCPTVLTGMGTTSAMVGAYILAGEIGHFVGGATGGRKTTNGLVRALESYEAKFRPFMDQVQKGLLEKSTGQWMMAETAAQVGFMNWMMGVASFFAQYVNLTSAFGIRETVKGWHLPKYEGLGDLSHA